MVGCDEGKPSASARCGGRRDGHVPSREGPPPAGQGDPVAARPRPPLSGRDARLADVGGHVIRAEAGCLTDQSTGPVSTSSAERICRSRSWPRRASRLRLSADTRPLDARRLNEGDGFGTNRERISDEESVRTEGAERRRPPLTAASRRIERRPAGARGEATRRRDAQPHRSGGRRGWDGKAGGRLTPRGTQGMSDNHADLDTGRRSGVERIGNGGDRGNRCSVSPLGPVLAQAAPGIGHGTLECRHAGPRMAESQRGQCRRRADGTPADSSFAMGGYSAHTRVQHRDGAHEARRGALGKSHRGSEVVAAGPSARRPVFSFVLSRQPTGLAEKVRLRCPHIAQADFGRDAPIPTAARLSAEGGRLVDPVARGSSSQACDRVPNPAQQRVGLSRVRRKQAEDLKPNPRPAERHEDDPDHDHALTSGAAGMTRTSWRSGRRVATGSSPALSRSRAMARSVGHLSAPLSSVLRRPGDFKPSRAASSRWVQPFDFRHEAHCMLRMFCNSEHRVNRACSEKPGLHALPAASCCSHD